MAELAPVGGERWEGLNLNLDPVDMPPGMSPFLENCWSDIQGILGPRFGVKFVSNEFDGEIRGVMPFALSQEDGRYWIVAYEAGGGGGVTLSAEAALWQGNAASIVPIPGVGSCGGCFLMDLEWDLLGTSGAFALSMQTPDGTFTLSTAEVDSAAVKTETIGCLRFNYAGAARGSRGILSVTGIGKVGTYTYTRTITGSIVSDSDLTITRSIRYTSAGEGYNNQLLAQLNVVHGWESTYTPFVFAEP